MQKYFVYILRCHDGTLYTGITSDLSRRTRQHNGELVGGAKYTASRRPVKEVYSKIYSDKSSALREEQRIKSMTRKQKLCLLDRK